MTPGPGDLFGLCQEFLEASIEALNTIPTYEPQLEGAPERAFVSPGRPALEGCDQLAVYADLVNDAPTAPGGLEAGRRRVAKRNHVTVVITIDRCVEDSRQGNQTLVQPFPAADLEAAAQQTDADGWALWNHLYNIWHSEGADPPFTFCNEVFFEGMRALPEEGGRAGWVLVMRTILDGYNEVISS